jgi:hypothetical protein
VQQTKWVGGAGGARLDTVVAGPVGGQVSEVAWKDWAQVARWVVGPGPMMENGIRS